MSTSATVYSWQCVAIYITVYHTISNYKQQFLIMLYSTYIHLINVINC